MIPKFSHYKIYQYSESTLKDLPAETLKQLKKHFYNVNIDRRNHNGGGLATTGPTVAEITTLKKNYAKDSNLGDRITKFQNILKTEHVYRIPPHYFTDLGKINFPQELTMELSYIWKQK